MKHLIQRLRSHTFETYLVAILLMSVPSLFLYLAAGNHALGWIWFWLGLVVCGNLLVILIK